MNVELDIKHKEFLTEKLLGKTLMISGATGLVGSAIIRYLIDLNDNHSAQIKIIGLYKDEEKKNKIYPKDRNDLSFAVYNETDGVKADADVDYIVHAAGISGGSKMHLKDPVKIFIVGIDGTRKLLDYAVNHGCKGFCYVSTYEIYGGVNNDELIKEDHPCLLDPMILRNSYAEVKRVCESMLTAYSAKNEMKVYSGRLTSTFGTGVSYNDPRFFAEFARCAIEGRDIVLKSTGGTVRNYLDVDDAASAFLYILINGENNNAYNLTNMENAISIRDIAKKIIEVSGAQIELKYDIAENTNALGFRKEGCTVMSAQKLTDIGWDPVYFFDETIEKMIKTMKRCY